MAFIDANRDRRTVDGLVWGVEPICAVVQFAPSTYYAARDRAPSARDLRDEQLEVEIRRVFDHSGRRYGAKKIWEHLNQEDGIEVARCTVERLTARMGIEGVTKGAARPRTTIGDAEADRPADLVERDFTADAPNQLWVADITYIKTHTGWVYAAFIIDVFSRFIVGWQTSRSLRAELALDALEMAIYNRRRAGTDLAGLVHHSDRGSQYVSIRYSCRLDEIDSVASVGSRGDSYDNALAESFNGTYKAELIHHQGPWQGLDDVTYATLEYIDWFNHRRLHGHITDGPRYTTPARFEAEWHAATDDATISTDHSPATTAIEAVTPTNQPL